MAAAQGEPARGAERERGGEASTGGGGASVPGDAQGLQDQADPREQHNDRGGDLPVLRGGGVPAVPAEEPVLGGASHRHPHGRRGAAAGDGRGGMEAPQQDLRRLGGRRVRHGGQGPASLQRLAAGAPRDCCPLQVPLARQLADSSRSGSCWLHDPIPRRSLLLLLLLLPSSSPREGHSRHLRRPPQWSGRRGPVQLCDQGEAKEIRHRSGFQLLQRSERFPQEEDRRGLEQLALPSRLEVPVKLVSRP
mmetsp:Transcript_14611/g.49883  ORF Transcript_14611/g.49883 Transcript_14611/m.49883 type:complete len:249 (-) Transcript_14611:812-1558(-)